MQPGWGRGSAGPGSGTCWELRAGLGKQRLVAFSVTFPCPPAMPSPALEPCLPTRPGRWPFLPAACAGHLSLGQAAPICLHAPGKGDNAWRPAASTTVWGRKRGAGAGDQGLPEEGERDLGSARLEFHKSQFTDREKERSDRWRWARVAVGADRATDTSGQVWHESVGTAAGGSNSLGSSTWSAGHRDGTVGTKKEGGRVRAGGRPEVLS